MLSPTWRNRLDSWQWWIGAAFFGLTCVVVALFFINQRVSRTLADQAQATAIRVAQTSTTAQTEYKRCVASIPLLANFARHVEGVNDGFQALVTNSRQGILATDPADPLYQTRVRNLIRLENAVKKVAAVKTFPVPTRASCAARRDAALKR